MNIAALPIGLAAAALPISLAVPAARPAASPPAGVTITQVRITPADAVVEAIQPTEVSAKVWTTGAKQVVVGPQPKAGLPEGAEPEEHEARSLGESGPVTIWQVTFKLNRDAAPGPWVLKVTAGDGDEATARQAAPFTVRRFTQIKDFNVAPDEVARGGRIKVSGELRRLDPFAVNTAYHVPFGGQRVKIYHRAQGARSFKPAGTATTSPAGRFSKTFKATKDGTWRAGYPGSATQAPQRSTEDHVDVH